MLFALSLGFLCLLAQLMQTDWFYAGLGVSTKGTAMALALFSQVLGVFTFPFSPLFSFLSRSHEFEADAYAARQSSAADLVRALVKLYKENAATLTPDPLHSAFYDSHPPAALRIGRVVALNKGHQLFMAQHRTLRARNPAVKGPQGLYRIVAQSPLASGIQAQPVVASGHLGPFGHGLKDQVIHARASIG